MAGQMHDDEEPITGINVTPLVDVMLVLLIIFMTTANYMTNKTIKVNLPQAETGESEVVANSIAFVLDKDSVLYIDGDKTSWQALPSSIKKALKKADVQKRQLQAIISADVITPHGKVIKLIDTLRKMGIFDFAINVEATSMELSKPKK